MELTSLLHSSKYVRSFALVYIYQLLNISACSNILDVVCEIKNLRGSCKKQVVNMAICSPLLLVCLTTISIALESAICYLASFLGKYTKLAPAVVVLACTHMPMEPRGC